MISTNVLIYGLLASLTGGFGALYLKKGAKSFSAHTPVNKNLVVGGILYAVTTIFFVLGLRDSPLSFFYPFTSLLYLFASVLGFYVLKEKINQYKLFGICLVLLGVVLISVGR